MVVALVAASFAALAVVPPSAVTRADETVQRFAQNSTMRSSSPAARQALPAGPTRVYLLRGLLNVFSLGMDDLAAKLRANGISAVVTNHADSDIVASQILSTYNAGDRGPIVLIGHSLGADAVVELADTLAQYNVPVALLILYDGTNNHEIPGNVTTAINYTKHFFISDAPGSRAVISNVDFSADPSIDHLSIDTAPALQAQTMGYIMKVSAAGTAPVRR